MYCKFLKLSTFLKNYLRSLSLSFFLLIIYCLLFTLLLDLGGLQYIFRSQEISSFSASIPAHCAINTGYFCKILYSVLFPTAGCTWIIEMGNITVSPVAHLFTEVKVLYTSNIAYYVPGKNLGRSKDLQKASKPGKFLFSILNSEFSVIYSICSKTEMLSNEENGTPITVSGSRESLRMTSGVFLWYI